jgi:signal transduction histidine kinase
MEGVHPEILQAARGGDGSPGTARSVAERSASGDPTARRLLDDVIERDRISADQGLWKFRKSADNLLARRRSKAAVAPDSVVEERDGADQRTRLERADTDARLGLERQRADAAIDSERREHESCQAKVEALRQATNAELLTERARADVAVAALDESAASLAHIKSEHGHDRDVLAMVAHDLRSPLSIITINAQFMADSAQDPTLHEVADEVTGAAARMERLLTDLLDAVRIDSGTLRIDKRPNDVGVLVSQIFHSYQPLFASRDITFTAQGPTEVTVVAFDHDRIVQVLSNLLGNAMKFTPAHGAVSLHARRVDQRVEFLVRDDGPGIEPSEMPHIFERFWQLDSAARRGLGLGLHICERIVEGHAGRIWVESALGKGASFFFTLPVA